MASCRRRADRKSELGGRVVPYMDEVFGQAIDEMFGQPFALLLRRKTYEIFAAHWPYAEGGEDDFIAKRFNITKYVATRSNKELMWRGSVALHDAAADVARLKEENGPALVTQGSSDLIQSLLAHNLIDEICLFTFPLVLGKGKTLFGEGAKPAAFSLKDNRATTKGVMIARYERAGAIMRWSRPRRRSRAARTAKPRGVDQAGYCSSPTCSIQSTVLPSCAS